MMDFKGKSKTQGSATPKLDILRCARYVHTLQHMSATTCAVGERPWQRQRKGHSAAGGIAFAATDATQKVRDCSQKQIDLQCSRDRSVEAEQKTSARTLQIETTSGWTVLERRRTSRRKAVSSSSATVSERGTQSRPFSTNHVPLMTLCCAYWADVMMS